MPVLSLECIAAALIISLLITFSLSFVLESRELSIQQLEERKKADEERKKEAKVINEKIKNKQYEIKKLSTENKELYGSIKPTEISKILEEKEQVKVNPSLIQPSKEIKSLGDFDVLINLHPEVQTQIVIKAVAQEEAK